MSIIQASFFWKNDQPGGIGITFGPPTFSPDDLEMMFEGAVYKKFARHSDMALGTNIVETLMGQLTSIGRARLQGDPVSQRQAIMAALNILWLSSRGFLPNDEFNGSQFIGIDAAQTRVRRLG